MDVDLGQSKKSLVCWSCRHSGVVYDVASPAYRYHCPTCGRHWRMVETIVYEGEDDYPSAVVHRSPTGPTGPERGWSGNVVEMKDPYRAPRQDD